MKRETMEKLRESGFELCPGGELRLSEKYKAFEQYLEELVSGEGPVGEYSYLRLWKKSEIEQENNGYQTQEWLSDVILIGSDGGGEAYGIDKKGRFIMVPFIGGCDEEVEVLGRNFDEFIDCLYRDCDEEEFESAEDFEAEYDEGEGTHSSGAGLKGMYIHHIKPVIFGGSPTDPDNMTVVSPEEHKKYTAFWRRIWMEAVGKRKMNKEDNR